MGEGLVHASLLEGGEADQPAVVAQVQGDLRLAKGLGRAAHQPGDLDHGGVGLSHGFGGQLEHGAIEPHLRVVDRELGGMHADGKAARAGGSVITHQGALVALVELALRRERQRTGRDHPALEEPRAKVR